MLKLIAFILLLFAISQSNAGILDTALGDEYDEDIALVAEDLITDLDNDSFNKTVHCSDDLSHCTAYFVMFYNSNSKMSQIFSRVYFLVSIITEEWKKVVKLGAIDCAEAGNKKLCFAHGFRRVPLFKYFERKSKNGNTGKTVPPYTNGVDLLEELASQINREYQAHPYSDWPNFTPLPEFHNSVNDVWKYSKGKNEIMLIFVENATEPEGMSMFIEASNAANGLPVRRVLKGHYLARVSKTIKYPSGSILEHYNENKKDDCRDPAGKKEKSIFNHALTKLEANFEVGEFEEKIYTDHKSIIYRCKNYTDYSYRHKRDVKLTVLDPSFENKEIIVETKVEQFKKPVEPTLIELKKKLTVKP